MPFTVSEELIEVKVEYVEIDGQDTIVIRDDEQKEFWKKNGEIKVAKAYFERPRWSSFNQYIKGCVKEDGNTGEVAIDSMLLRDNKLRVLLKKLIDGNGEEVKLDYKFFDNIVPDFAVGLVETYDASLNKERYDFVEKMEKMHLESVQRSKDEEKQEKAEEAAEDKDEQSDSEEKQ